MAKRPHAGPTLDEKEGRTVIDCTECGFTHILPLPTEEALTAFYQEAFYAVERPKYFSDTEEDIDWWMATYRNYFDVFEQHTNGRRILDVGSGPGYFLLAGQERGWEALGIEPSPDACAYATEHGARVVQEFFTYDAAKAYGPFDVVHASMVLEHVPDPCSMIEDIKRLLAPGGILAIFSPNDYNPLQSVAREGLTLPPYWVVPDHHLNYFNVPSMQRVLEGLGLEVVDTLATFPLEFFLLAGRNYITDPSLGRGSHHMRTIFEEHMYAHNPVLLNELYRRFATLGVGREFIMLAKAPITI